MDVASHQHDTSKPAQRRYVRPWALAAPIIVLLIALPLLRPLRHPLQVSTQESARLLAIAAHVEPDRPAPKDPEAHPIFSLLLSAPYWVMHKLGLRMDQNVAWVSYLLTILGATLPVAASAGLIYRMSRVFELRRPWRAGLALAVVLASGLFTYATVLNPHAPAAMAILAASACLIHVTVAGQPLGNGAALVCAGFLASLAAVLDPLASIFLLLLPFPILAMTWSFRLRGVAVLLYIVGAVGPIALHVTLTRQSTSPSIARPSYALSSHSIAPDDSEESFPRDSFWVSVGAALGHFLNALFGPHGLLSHFPVMLVALAGVGAVMHRHWPGSTKVLAATSVAAAVIVIAATIAFAGPGRNAMYATRYFICFSPLLLFWSGAFLRRSHHAVTWTIVGVLLAFSIITSLIGATNPYPPGGYDSYTPVAALHELTHSAPAPERLAATH